MRISSFFYDLIYQKNVNYLLRNLCYPLKKILKNSYRIPPSGVLLTKTKGGTIKIATNQTSYLTKLLFWEGYQNFEYTVLFESLARKVDVFIDIGANIGYYSLLLAKNNTEADIHAFEPAFGPKHYLKKNIKLNGFDKNIKAIDWALSNQKNDIDFYEVKNEKYSSVIYNLSGEHNAGTKKESRNFFLNTVKSTTLSNYIKSEKLAKIDLIKIDTEGTEVSILEAGRNEIDKFKPIVICETLFNTTENQLESFFKSLNYDFYNHSEKGLEKVSSIKRTTDNQIRNCFFVPKSKTNLISEYVVS